jgi:hypothetical protein
VVADTSGAPERVELADVGEAPQRLQFDIAVVVLRLRQIEARGCFATELGELLLKQVLTHDLPRLESHLTADTRDWFATHGVPWPSSVE